MYTHDWVTSSHDVVSNFAEKGNGEMRLKGFIPNIVKVKACFGGNVFMQ